MSTRRAASPDSPLVFERYMSAPQFAELRGLPGNLVAAKAQLYQHRRHREMLFFLQSASLRNGGLKALAAQIVQRWPERLQSALMSKSTVRAGDQYPNAGEIGYELGVARDFHEPPSIHARAAFEPNTETPLQARETCGKLADRYLHRFIEELCLNPEIDLEELERAGWDGWAPYVTHLWDSLATLKRDEETTDPEPTVTTALGAKVEETLDFALRNGKLVVCEGAAGSGKSTAAERWARRHPGRVRMISLSGIMHRTGFFQRVAMAVGLATSQRKASELQAKVEAFFQTTGLMLVIDEAHYLWPQSKRVTHAPEMINWVNTALVNQGVPVALICTDQFTRLKETVEKGTGWTSEQLMHRIRRYVKLDGKTSEADLFAVARLGLSKAWRADSERWVASGAKVDSDSLKFVVGYALASRLPLAAIRDCIEDARDVAMQRGSGVVTFEDLEKARADYQIPSDLAMKQVFACKPTDSKKGRPVEAGGPSKAYVADRKPARPVTAHVARAVAPVAPSRGMTLTVEAVG